MPHHQKLSTKQISELNQQRSSPLNTSIINVLLHNIRSMHNVGSVFRSADAFGIHEILLSGYTPVPPRPEISKTALGADEHVKFSTLVDIRAELLKLKQNKFKFVGLEQTTASISIYDLDIEPEEKILLIFGNEVTGIDEEILPFVDVYVEIPQYGVKHSLNISVSAGITFFSLCDKLYQRGKSVK